MWHRLRRRLSDQLSVGQADRHGPHGCGSQTRSREHVFQSRRYGLHGQDSRSVRLAHRNHAYRHRYCQRQGLQDRQRHLDPDRCACRILDLRQSQGRYLVLYPLRLVDQLDRQLARRRAQPERKPQGVHHTAYRSLGHHSETLGWCRSHDLMGQRGPQQGPCDRRDH